MHAHGRAAEARVHRRDRVAAKIPKTPLTGHSRIFRRAEIGAKASGEGTASQRSTEEPPPPPSILQTDEFHVEIKGIPVRMRE